MKIFITLILAGFFIDVSLASSIVDRYDFTFFVKESKVLPKAEVENFKLTQGQFSGMAMSNRWALPKNSVYVFYQDCNQQNAFYQPKYFSIFMCYELFDLFLKITRNRSVAWYMFDFVFFHELGHALMHQYDLPALGKNEDIADAFAVVTYLKLVMDNNEGFAKASFIINVANYFGRGGIDWADTHTTGPQRNVDLVCLAIGAYPRMRELPSFVKKTGSVLRSIDSAKRNCPNEFLIKLSAVRRVFGPYMLLDFPNMK